MVSPPVKIGSEEPILPAPSSEGAEGPLVGTGVLDGPSAKGAMRAIRESPLRGIVGRGLAPAGHFRRKCHPRRGSSWLSLWESWQKSLIFD